MRRLRKTIALYLILVLAVCALTSFPIYAKSIKSADPQGESNSKKDVGPGPTPIDWINKIIISIGL